jgi:peptidyl-prolyl cis-trans isomerase SurA
MKIRSLLQTILILILPVICQAQDLNSKILMTVDGTSTEAGEFIRMYKKSLEPGKSMPLDDYLRQFTLFRLKVADAISEGYDTTAAFRNELNGYRSQLAQNYLTDTQAKEKLLRKAYQRSLSEINAWHILIAMPQNAYPADTLKAWKKACDIRERIINGEPFEQVARSASDDQSVKINGGNLGYFTVFQMIMPFEDAAYSMKKGALSMPVRTPFGYHIIKVTDIRPSKGRIQVAHIMKNAPPGTSEEESGKAGKEINDIYLKLKEGAQFSELAKKYSDHKESAEKGGVLNWFGTGEMIPDFSEAAFSLTDTGNYTKPFRTLYGWHIVKLIAKKPPGSYEESCSYLESRINQSYLNTLSRRTFVDRLKKEYKFRINEASFNWFTGHTDTLIIQGLTKYDRSLIPAGYIYSFAKQSLTNNDFADYIERTGPMVVTRDSAFFVSHLLEISASDQLISYENSVLEKKYPEFRYLMNEFHDGILLFEISNKKVWDRVNHDSLGLHEYYEDNKSNYLSKKEMEAKIYTLKVKDGERALFSTFKKVCTKPDLDKRLLEKFNKKNDTALIIRESIWKKGTDPAIDSLEWVTGTVYLTMGGFPSVVVVKKVSDPVPLKFEEVQEKIMTGYQEYLESEWTRQLKERYNVKIDSFVLDEIKRKLTNE